MKNSKFLRSKNLLKSLEAEELKSLNDERQEREDNGNIDSVSVIPEIRNRESMVNKTPLSRAAFTLVELVITIAIVIILSVISVPLYRGYVDKAKWSEGYALLGTIFSAQKAYYSEYGNFYSCPSNSGSSTGWTSYDTVLGIDARGNKYFSYFQPGPGPSATYDIKIYFKAYVKKPTEFQESGKTKLSLQYNITKGAEIRDTNFNWEM